MKIAVIQADGSPKTFVDAKVNSLASYSVEAGGIVRNTLAEDGKTRVSILIEEADFAAIKALIEKAGK